MSELSNFQQGGATSMKNESSFTRKRKCPDGDSSLISEEKSKRKRNGDNIQVTASTPPEASLLRADSVVNEDVASPSSSSSSSSLSSSCSVESLLSVPLDFIFREAPSASASSSSSSSSQQQQHSHSSSQKKRRREGRNHRHLLSRMESLTLLRVSQLAYELDVLLSISFQALSSARACRTYRQAIETSSLPIPYNQYLRSVLPTLQVHGERVPNIAIQYVSTEVERVLIQLHNCAVTLRQFAEQNWDVAESLFDTFGGCGVGVGGGDGNSSGNGSEDTTSEEIMIGLSPGRDLAREKRAVSEIEEEVCVRIDRLMNMATLLGTSSSVGDDAAGGVGGTGYHHSQDKIETKVTFQKEERQSGRTNITRTDDGEANTTEEANAGASIMDAFDHATDVETGRFISMRGFCERLLQPKEGTRTNKKGSIDNVGIGHVTTDQSTDYKRRNGVRQVTDHTTKDAPKLEQGTNTKDTEGHSGNVSDKGAGVTRHDDEDDIETEDRRSDVEVSGTQCSAPITESIDNAASALAVLASTINFATQNDIRREGEKVA